MTRPKNPYELIYAPSGDVPYPHWKDDVGDRSVFRVSGLWEYRIKGGRDDKGEKGFVNQSRLDGAKRAMASSGWEEYCVKPRTELTASGVEKIVKARNGRRSPTSLHTALILVLMLEDYLSKKLPGIDIYGANEAPLIDPLRIVPFIFDLRMATAETYPALERKGSKILINARQDNLEFLRHMCRGQEMFSERTCRVVSDAGGFTAGIENVIGVKRAEKNGGYRPPCLMDKLVYPM